MEKARLKRVRNEFRAVVFKRDSYKCVFCTKQAVDAHHITDRNEMPNGGYVVENGISVCHRHHQMAEQFHVTGGIFWFKGFSPFDLYRKVGSTYEQALAASLMLGDE